MKTKKGFYNLGKIEKAIGKLKATLNDDEIASLLAIIVEKKYITGALIENIRKH